MPNPEFRRIALSDLPMLDILDQDCATVDGSPAVPETPYADLIGMAWCVQSDGRIIASGWTTASNSTTAQGSTVILRGKVHPAYRHQGLGSALIEQLEKEAAESGGAQSCVIRSEALLPETESFYQKRGYTCDFVEVKMERDLAQPLPTLPLIDIELWSARNAPVFHAVFSEAFAERPGFQPVDAIEWISDHTDDETFRPDLSMLARWKGQPAGFITVFVDEEAPDQGYISQVGTPPFFRGRGIGAGLIGAAMTHLKNEGTKTAYLHVNENNPHATGLYERLGFEKVGRRGKYSKTAG